MAVGREHEPIEDMEEKTYRAFLVRAWQEPDVGPRGQPAWRFTLVQLDNGQTRRGFASLDDLNAYLRQELAAPRRADPGQSINQEGAE